MIVRDAAMNAVLTLGDTAVVGGYMAAEGYDEGGNTWEFVWSNATRVEDDFEQARRRGKRRLTLPVYIEAASDAAARTLQDALLDAVEDVQVWFLDVLGDGSVLWVCSSADHEPVQRFEGGRKRIITLSIPVSPGRGV